MSFDQSLISAQGTTTTIEVEVPRTTPINRGRKTTGNGHDAFRYSDYEKSPANIQICSTLENLNTRQQDEAEMSNMIAVRLIERTWICYRNRQMFKLLKHAICAAEHSLTHEILRKVCPLEAELLRDPSINVRVRFRFGGSEFPPYILFKIYTQSGGQGVQYVSGKTRIKPATNAAVDARRQMGNRRFYDQMIVDACHHDRYKITDQVDVTTIKDYMQYMSILDEMPAYLGGKENLWRKLDLNVMPRTTIMYDIMDYINTKVPSRRLKSQMSLLTTRPVTQELQLAHIRVISQLRSPAVLMVPMPTPKTRTTLTSSGGQSARRSRQAKERASRMRAAYTPGINSNFPLEDEVEVHQLKFSNEEAHTVTKAMNSPKIKTDDDIMDEEEEWDKEADKLYAWTKDLSFEEYGLYTPS